MNQMKLPRHSLAKKVQDFFTVYSEPGVDRGDIASYALRNSSVFPANFIGDFLQKFSSDLSYLSEGEEEAQLKLAKKIMSRLINKEAYITNETQAFGLPSFFKPEPAVAVVVDPLGQFLGAHRQVGRELKKDERKEKKMMAKFAIAKNKVKNTGLKAPVLDDA